MEIEYIRELYLKDIIKYKTQRISYDDYSFGGWYMILDTSNNKKYIGKSIDYMHRLKSHLNVKNPKILIDEIIKLKGLQLFRFYLIDDYLINDVNFFNRKKEQKIEKLLIKNYKTFVPYGYNVRYYE